jgi:hypothetical protein
MVDPLQRHVGGDDGDGLRMRAGGDGRLVARTTDLGAARRRHLAPA